MDYRLRSTLIFLSSMPARPAKRAYLLCQALLAAAAVALWLNPLSAWLINVRYAMTAYLYTNLGLAVLLLLLTLAAAWGFRRVVHGLSVWGKCCHALLQALLLLSLVLFSFFTCSLYTTLNSTLPLGERLGN